MPDYAGAVAAIEAYAVTNWANATRIITDPNAVPGEPWPPIDPATSNLAPWVLLEVRGTQENWRAGGEPGNQFLLATGLIIANVRAPLASGKAVPLQLAVNFGTMFRNKVFYNDTPGFQVRTLFPYPPGDVAKDDTDGTWFNCTTTIPFEYYHRG